MPDGNDGNNQANQAQPQAAGEGAAHGVGRNVAPCPKYDGVEDELTVLSYCDEVELWKMSGAISDEAAAAAVIMNFTGAAKEWKAAEMRQSNNALNKWSTLKKAIKERFITKKANLSQDLKQRKDETVSRFFDRVRDAVYLMHRDASEATRNNEIHKLVVKRTTMDYFVNGCHKNIKNRMLSNGDNVKTDEELTAYDLKKLKEIAIRYEAADAATAQQQHGDGSQNIKKEKLDAIENMSLDDLRAEVARGRKARKLEEVQCFHCNDFGHYRPNCPKKDQPAADPAGRGGKGVRGRGRGRGRGGRGGGRGGNNNAGDQHDGQQQPGAAAQAAPAAAAAQPTGQQQVDAVVINQMIEQRLKQYFEGSKNVEELCAKSPFPNEYKSRTSAVEFTKPLAKIIMQIASLISLCSFSGVSIEASNTNRPTVLVRMGGVDVRCLVDSGASCSAMSREIFEALPRSDRIKRVPMPNTVELQGAGGKKLSVAYIVQIPCSFLGVSRWINFIICNHLASGAILGWDVCSELGGQICARRNTLVLPGPIDGISLEKAEKETETWECASVCASRDVEIPAYHSARVPVHLITSHGAKVVNEGCAVVAGTSTALKKGIVDGIIQCNKGDEVCTFRNNTRHPITIHAREHIGEADNFSARTFDIFELVRTNEKIPEFKPTEISKEKRDYILKNANIGCEEPYKSRYLQLLLKYHDCISLNKFDLGCIRGYEHNIKLVDETPVHIRQFPTPVHLKPVLDDYVDRLTKAKVIESSTSPYNSPIFCIKKKHGDGYRVIQDVRGINSVSQYDKYIFKTFNECINDISTRKSTVFSNWDARQGFFQLRLSDVSKKYTAFTLDGRKQWTRCVQGLHGTPSSFGRVMEIIVENIGGMTTFIDDVLSHDKNHEEHLPNAEKFLRRCVMYNLKLNLEKTRIAHDEVTFLGNEISKRGYRPSIDNTAAIKLFKEPDSPRKIREFIGMANFFRQFIRNFTKIADPLNRLLLKSSDYKGGPLPADASLAFRTLKEKLCKRPLLHMPDFAREFFLFTDGAVGSDECNGGLGALLAQKNEKGDFLPISFASRTLKSHEKNASAWLVENLAGAWAMEKYDQYLRGNKFTWMTDHRPITQLPHVHKKTLNRIQELLNQYQFTIEYCPSSANAVSDCLSRNALPVEAITAEVADLKKLQELDDDIKAVREWIESREKSDLKPELKKFAKDCVIKDGVVYVKENLLNLELPRKQYWPPRRIIPSLISQHHSSTLTMHRGIFTTLFRLRCKFRWPNMSHDVTEFIKRCDICQRTKTSPHARKAPLKPYEPCYGPNQRIFMDLFTGIPCGNGKKKHILTMTCGFSKYAEITTINDKTAKSVADAFYEKWILRHTIPDCIVHDGGKEFDSDLMKCLTSKLGIVDIKTCPLSPWMNGQSEVLNKQLIKFLQQLDKFDVDTWEEYIPSLQCAYNCSVSKAHLMTPFFVLYGRQPKLNAFDPRVDSETPSDPSSFEKFSKMKKIRETAVQQLQKTAERMKEQYDKKTKEKSFAQGDAVLIFYPKNNVRSSFWKAAREWCGPYAVLKRCGELTYLVQFGTKKPFKVHVNRMKPYFYGKDEWNAEVLSPHEIDESEFLAELLKDIEIASPTKKSYAQVAASPAGPRSQPAVQPATAAPAAAPVQPAENPQPATRAQESETEENEENDDVEMPTVNPTPPRPRYQTRSTGPVANQPWIPEVAPEYEHSAGEKRKNPNPDDTMSRQHIDKYQRLLDEEEETEDALVPSLLSNLSINDPPS